MINVLCICPNRQTVLNILPVINTMREEKEVHISFLNVDPFLHQDTASLIVKEDLVELNIRLKKPFYQLSVIGQLITIFLQFPKISFGKEYDILILGGLGVFEYYIAKKLKKNNKTKVYLIQDAILLQPENFLIKKKLRKFIYGFKNYRNICDKIFVSGKATKDTMVMDGIIRDKVIISGIPRFSDLFIKNQKLEKKRERKIKVLFLGTAFRWHGKANLEKKELKILSQLEIFAKTNSDIIKVFLKRHPRDNTDKNYAFLKHIKILTNNKSNNYEVIEKFDLIICAQSISTLIFEAQWLNKMVIFLFPNKSEIKANEERLRKNLLIIENFYDLKNVLKDIYKNKIDNRLFGNNKNYFISEKSEFAKKIISKEIQLFFHY